MLRRLRITIAESSG